MQRQMETSLRPGLERLKEEAERRVGAARQEGFRKGVDHVRASRGRNCPGSARRTRRPDVPGRRTGMLPALRQFPRMVGCQVRTTWYRPADRLFDLGGIQVAALTRRAGNLLVLTSAGCCWPAMSSRGRSARPAASGIASGRRGSGRRLLLLVVLLQPNTDTDAVGGTLHARRGPVARDHVDHLTVAVQHVHLQQRHAPGLGPRDQCAHQRRAQPPALPRVGHHNADVRHQGATGAGAVRRHGVPDDDAVPDRDHGVDGVG